MAREVGEVELVAGGDVLQQDHLAKGSLQGKQIQPWTRRTRNTIPLSKRGLETVHFWTQRASFRVSSEQDLDASLRRTELHVRRRAVVEEVRDRDRRRHRALRARRSNPSSLPSTCYTCGASLQLVFTFTGHGHLAPPTLEEEIIAEGIDRHRASDPRTCAPSTSECERDSTSA